MIPLMKLKQQVGTAVLSCLMLVGAGTAQAEPFASSSPAIFGDLNIEALNEINQKAHEALPYSPTAFSADPRQAQEELAKVVSDRMRDSEFHVKVIAIKNDLQNFLASGGLTLTNKKSDEQVQAGLSLLVRIEVINPLLPILLKSIAFESMDSALGGFKTENEARYKAFGASGAAALVNPVVFVGVALGSMLYYNKQRKIIYDQQSRQIEYIQACAGTSLQMDSEMSEYCKSEDSIKRISYFRTALASSILYSILSESLTQLKFTTAPNINFSIRGNHVHVLSAKALVEMNERTINQIMNYGGFEAFRPLLGLVQQVRNAQ